MSARKPKRQPANRLNAFEEKTELEEVADDIFGASAAPEFNTGRVVARPTPLNEIWADVRQPRRAIPASIRLVWNGSPADVPQLLDTWAAVAADATGRTINIAEIIQGEGEGVDTDGTPAIYESFISLLRLAGSILREGLINPITIIDQHERHLIESGERRWLAYWLLHLHTQAPDEFARIPAAVASGADYIWRQAAENTARRSLNAVGMARQLALLIMAARGVDQYADYDQIVPPGGSDRRYYAQVADGNTHRIPKGTGERIQAAMALAMEQISRYRSIIRLTEDDEINDILWLRGDIEDWPERAFRDVDTLPLGKVRDILSRDAWSLDDFRTAAAYSSVKAQPPAPPAPPPPQPAQGYQAAEAEEARRVLDDIRHGFARAYTMGNSTVGIEQIAADRATRLLNQAQQYYDKNRLVSANESLAEAFRILDEAAPDNRTTPPTSDDTDNPLLKQLGGLGATVQTRSGHIGTLVELNGRLATVENVNGRRQHDALYLRKVDAPPPTSGETGRPKPSTSDAYMHRIYESWRAAFKDSDLLLITEDANFYIALSTDDAILRRLRPDLQAGHIGLSGGADHMLVSKISADLMAEVIGQYADDVLAISYADLNEDMQYVAGTALRARNIPLNDIPATWDDTDDDQDEPIQPPPGGKFQVGDKVDTSLGRTGGEVIGIDGKRLNVSFPGSPPFWTTIANIVFIERPQPPASDKIPSAGSKSGYVVERNTQAFTLLMQIKTLASVTGHKDIFDTLDTLLNMNWDTARDLTQAGELNDTLQLYYDGFTNVLSNVSTTLGEFLDDLHKQLAE